MIVRPQCFDCRHFDREGFYVEGRLNCGAFPDPPGIPAEILTADHDHRRPFAGDRGIRFEPADEAESFDEF